MRTILFILFALPSFLLLSQTSSTIYYDNDWNQIPSKNGASFYRTSNFDSTISKFIIKDFFITGEIQMEVIASSVTPEIKDGEAKYFYKSGALKIKKFYSKNKADGDFEMYYPNGKLLKKGKLSNDNFNGEWVFYSPSGKKHMEGTFKMEKKVGVWKIYNFSGELFATKTYLNGNLKEINCLSCDSTGYFEYEYNSTDLGEVSASPRFEIIKQNEFILFEKLMLSNINYLESNPLSTNLSLIAPYTVTWTSNAPYLEKFILKFSKFTEDYISIDNSANYGSILYNLYLMGKCKYLINNKSKSFNSIESEFSGVISMLKAYKSIKAKDNQFSNPKLEELIKKRDSNKLKRFIKGY